MIKIIRSVLSPILSATILTLGNSLFMTITSLKLKMNDRSLETIGLITALYFTGLVLGAFYCNRLIERVGHIRSFAIFAAFCSALVMLQAIFTEVWMWAVIRFFVGFSIAGLFATIESWLVAKSTIDTKGKVLSIYMIAFYLSTGLGQLLLNVADPATLIPFAIIAIFTAFSIIPVSITKIQAPVIEGPSYLNIFKLFKITPLGVIGCMISGLILGSIYGLVPVFAEEENFSLSEIALCSSVTILGGFVLQWPLGQLSDILDRRKIISSVGFGTAFMGLAVTFFPTSSFSFLLILLGALGGFAFTIYPLCISHGSDRVEAKDIVAATASLGLAFNIGAVAGPLAAAYLMRYFGPKGLFMFIGFAGLLLAFYALYRISKAPGVLKEEKTRYRNIDKTEPIATKLYSTITKEKNNHRNNRHNKH